MGRTSRAVPDPPARSRYLVRELDSTPPLPAALPRPCAIVGPGRMGTALAAALRAAGVPVEGPLGRGEPPGSPAAVLLCVPDAAIAGAAAAIAPGPLVGHCSGATGLGALGAHEGFALHPLMTVPAEGPPRFAGAGCAVAGTTDRALAAARALGERLGMRPIAVADEDRAAYHAAASVASNFLLTLEGAAERLAATTGVDRAMLLPIVRATVENWGALGAERALTGPIARGDEATVEAHRRAIRERAPELLELYDVMAAATRRLAGRPA